MKKFTLALLVTLLCGLQVALAQTISVTGTVKSDTGEPLAGVAVLVSGTQRGVVTDAIGAYSIQVPANGSLSFTFMGMKSQEVAVDNRTAINIVMATDAEDIEGVMVVAFGTAKKEAFTGSAAVLDGTQIQRRQTSNISKALDGQVAGVQSISFSGQPGTSAKIRIRGVGSINASSDPLYVVDGVPFDGDLASINPADVESMTVLKDAASNSLYGARGANGVILINTKRGRSGNAVVNFEAKVGVNSRAVQEYDIMTNPGTYYEKSWEGLYNYFLAGGNSTTASAGAADRNLIGQLGYQVFSVPNGETMMVNGKMNPNATLGYYDQAKNRYYLPDDWTKEAYNNAVRQEYNLSVSGATDKMNYFMSAGYLDDQGYVVNSSLQRISTRLKADYQVRKWFKIGGNASYTNNKTNGDISAEGPGSTSSANMFYVTRYMAPIYPLYVREKDGQIRIDAQGLKVYDYGDAATSGINRPYMSQSNPVSSQSLNTVEYLSDIFSGKAFAEVSFLKDFKATLNVGADIDNTRYRDVRNMFYGQYANQGGYVFSQHDRSAALNIQQLITWKHSYGKHNVDVLAGHDYYSRKWNYLYGSREKMYNPASSELNNAISKQLNGSNANEYFTEGYLARAQYDYDNKYFFSASYRRDASSRFHPDNRWGNFWSVGASWLLSKESFMSNVKWVNMLKYKASYGAQGNDGLTNYYPYQNQYTLSNNAGQFATILSYIGNKDIKWETNYNFNTGVEFALFNDKLVGGFEFFSRKAKDLLFNRPVAPSLGYATYPDNVGDMRNVGFEFELTATPVATKDFSWRVSVNGTTYKNKILRLPEENREMGLVVGSFKYTEGGSIYDFYLRDYAGVNPETGQSRWWVYAEDGSREYTETWSSATQRVNGQSSLPKLYGGFSTSFDYKGIDLSVVFGYRIGGYAYDNQYAGLMHAGSSYDRGYNWHNDILNSWTPENPTSNIPIVDRGEYTNAASTRFLTDASYLSLQNITLGYTLPQSVNNALGIGSIRVYAVADNIALMSKRKGFDPRQSFNGLLENTYAPIRTISGGISVRF